jgi:hypothetical protein
MLVEFGLTEDVDAKQVAWSDEERLGRRGGG